ncbi:hypothetical protein V6N11_059324 [Hibiscus sabdariffa]|uniref:Uncharacterized protein n=1 Tax=Hibiscus sabdariffa TaxID=183260 RepID=A0ABR2U757_9ROSI
MTRPETQDGESTKSWNPNESFQSDSIRSLVMPSSQAYLRHLTPHVAPPDTARKDPSVYLGSAGALDVDGKELPRLVYVCRENSLVISITRKLVLRMLW